MKHPTIDETARAIAALQVSAAEKRVFADEASSAGDREGARVLLCCAENDEAVVQEYLSLTPGETDAVPGNGGELAITSTLFDGTPEYFVDTVRKAPNLLAAAASKERMDLADRAKVLNLAVGAAETIQPRNLTGEDACAPACRGACAPRRPSSTGCSASMPESRTKSARRSPRHNLCNGAVAGESPSW